MIQSLNHSPLPEALGVWASAGALRDLCIAGQPSGWQLLWAKRSGRAWWVAWQAADRRALVNVDAVTGEMLSTEVLDIAWGESRRQGELLPSQLPEDRQRSL